MKKWLKIIVPVVLLAGGAVVCAIRWQAWFGMPAEPQWRGEEIEFVFPAFVQDSTPESLDILLLGDIHSRLVSAEYDTLAARVPQTDIVAQAGDWMDRGQRYHQQLLFREWTNSSLADKPVIVCPGNHEYSKGWNKCLSPYWSETFPHPHNGPQAVPGASYYTDLPGLRFIVIDTNPLDRLVYLTRTLTWLRELQKGARDRFVVVMMHHPVYSAAQGRVHPLMYAAFRHALGEADLVIAGHDHNYLRRTPFVVLNTAGRPKQLREPRLTEASDTVPVYGVLSVKPSVHGEQPATLDLRVYHMADGVLIDSLYVDHY